MTEDKATATVTNIKDDPALPRLEEIGPYFSPPIEHGDIVQVHMGGYIARTQFVRHQLFIRALRTKGSEVDHDRDVGDGPRLHRALDRSPFRSVIMGRLYTHDHLRILERLRSGCLRIHLVQVLFVLWPPAAADNIDKGENARDGAIDHPILEIGEIFPARTPRIDGCRHPATQGKSIGVYTVISCVGAAFARARVYMYVDVDQARGDVEAGNIDHFRCWARLDMFRDLSNLVVFDRYVTDRVDPVFGINDVATFEHQVIRRLTKKRRGRQKSKQQHNPE